MKKTIYKQRRLGLLLLLISAAMLAIGGDCTAVLFLAPLGVYAMFTKNIIIYEEATHHAKKK